MKTQSQLIPPPAPHVFSLPEAHQLKCTAGSCRSPQRTQLPMGREPHTLPTFCSLTLETLWLISYFMINLLLTQNKYENAPVKSVKEATLGIFPPCLYSYWHALCVWVYALGTDSLFLQYSAETQWIITFCLCSEHRKGNTGKKHQWLHLLNIYKQGMGILTHMCTKGERCKRTRRIHLLLETKIYSPSAVASPFCPGKCTEQWKFTCR